MDILSEKKGITNPQNEREVMPFSGGPKAAGQMLQGLDTASRKKILEVIKARDPKMAELIESTMVSIEDLRFITPKMLAEFLSQIKIDDLALSLRISSAELKEHIFKNISNSLKRDLEEVIKGPPQSVKKIEECQSRILAVMKNKLERGELILSKSKDEMV